jgi:hypothetical protein
MMNQSMNDFGDQKKDENWNGTIPYEAKGKCQFEGKKIK